ncbi:MAG: hypothetical protein N4A54_02805 [Peptostreptococcaceae bacterium]|jgi:hypothetical protein|nr:hypothetical protein [Peptostreptococcaceae bacterium]
MELVNIQKYTKNFRCDVLDYKDNQILISKEYEDNNINYYAIFEYDIKKDRLNELYRYEIEEYQFTNQYNKIVGEELILLNTGFDYKIEVHILDIKNKSLKSKHIIKVNEEVSYIPQIIDNRYILFRTDIEDCDIKGYEKYHSKGFSTLLYLGDLKDDKAYIIEDKRVVQGNTCEDLILFGQKSKYIVFNENYMSDYEYELDIYDRVKANKLDIDKITSVEALHIMEFKDFCDEIKLGKEKLSFKTIKQRKYDGWVRVMYSNDDKLYFREKDFETQIESIYEINNYLDLSLKKEINHDNLDGELNFDNRIYEMIKNPNKIYIKGLFNCDYDLEFEEFKHAYFEELIDNIYIIISSWFEDSDENYHQLTYIIDDETKETKKYELNNKVFKNTVVLYDDSKFFE